MLTGGDETNSPKGKKFYKNLTQDDIEHSSCNISSNPSVAEERDTISLCASSNAAILTPSNMSRLSIIWVVSIQNK